MKRLGHIDSILTRHRIDDQEDLVRMNRIFNGLQLAHQLFINVEPTGCIHDDDIQTLAGRMLQGSRRDVHWQPVTLCEYGNFNLFPQNLKLLDCRWPIDIAGYH